MRKKMLVVCVALIFLVLFAAVCIAEAKERETIRLFEEKKVTIQIDEKGETLIPVDYGDVALNQVSAKSNGDKQFLFYIDYDGIHIIPVAKGKGNITITNTVNKKDKMTINLVIDESAVRSDSESLMGYLVFEHSFVQNTEKLTAKYYISGGKKPYNCTLSVYEPGGVRSGDFIAKKSVGKRECFAVGTFIYADLRIMDAEGNTYVAKSNPLTLFKSLMIVPEYDVYMLPAGEKTSIPFTISGNVGQCNAVLNWQLDKDNFTMQKDEQKIKLTDSGTLDITPQSDGYVNYYIYVEDKKGKQDCMHSGPIVKVSEKGTIKLFVDQSMIHAGEEITAHVELENCAFSRVEAVNGIMLYYQDGEVKREYLTGKQKRVDDSHYDITFIPKYRGVISVFLTLRDCPYREEGRNVIVLP